jgi:hypothetical protein
LSPKEAAGVPILRTVPGLQPFALKFLNSAADAFRMRSSMSQTPRPFSHPSFAGRIGVARLDITPPVGIYARNWGAAKHDIAESVHRPITLTAMTLTSPSRDRPLVFIDGDLGWWRPLSLFREFQADLLREFKADSSDVIFGLSHTHAGAPLMKPDPELPGGDLVRAWLEKVRQSTLAAVRQAFDSAVDGTLDWHVGRCALASVRDLPDPADADGRYICGYNPDVPADDTLLVGRVTDASGKPVATVVNYACHPTTLAWDNTAISPDYVGAMRATMEQVTGAPAMFMLGACGELSPRYQYVGDGEVADRHGRQLAFAALAALNDMEPPAMQLAYQGVVESGAPLAIWKHEPREVSPVLKSVESSVDLPLKDWPSADELEEQRLACDDRALEERLRRRRDIRRALGDGATFSLPIWAWRMGDAVLVGTCCEPYSFLQQELRRRFPDRTVLVLNLINGTTGYLPPSDLYDLNIYQAWQTPFDRGSLELVVEAMTDAIRQVLSD